MVKVLLKRRKECLPGDRIGEDPDKIVCWFSIGAASVIITAGGLGVAECADILNVIEGKSGIVTRVIRVFKSQENKIGTMNDINCKYRQ